MTVIVSEMFTWPIVIIKVLTVCIFLFSVELHFDSVSHNSLDGTAGRDFVAEFLFWATLTTVHLSKFAEDLIIYSSNEFNFVSLADAYRYESCC